MTFGKRIAVQMLLLGSILWLLMTSAKAQIQVVYTRSGASTVANPTFSPASPFTGGATSVTISDTTNMSVINYCTDTINTCTPSTQYTLPLSFSSTEYIRAQAYVIGGPSSSVVSWQGTYQAPAATPTFSPVAGSYSSTQSVTISDSTGGSSITYCFDTTNTCTPTTSYSSAVSVSSTGYLRAQATASGFSASAIGSAQYTITSSTNVVAGTYTAPGGSSYTVTTSLPWTPKVVIVQDNSATLGYTMIATDQMASGACVDVNATQSKTSGCITIVTNGFSVGSSNLVNNSGDSIYWAAFGGANVFTGSYTGNGTTQNVTGSFGGITPNFAMVVPSPAATQTVTWASTSNSAGNSFNLGNAQAANQITGLIANGFSVGTAAVSNTNTNTYYYWLSNLTSSNFATATYSGTGAAQNITTVGFQPTFVLAHLNFGVGQEYTHSSMPTGDSATFGCTGCALSTTGITGILSNGFSVGTDSPVNASGFTAYYWAWK